MPRRKHQVRQDFWDELTRKIENESTVLSDSFDRTDSAGPERDNWRAWRNLPAGAGLGISVHLHDYIYVYLYLAHLETEELFRYLKRHRDEIEAAFDSQLRWRPTGDGAEVRGKDKIVLLREADVLENPEKWDEYHDWLVRSAERFYGVFRPHLRAYEKQASSPR